MAQTEMRLTWGKETKTLSGVRAYNAYDLKDELKSRGYRFARNADGIGYWGYTADPAAVLAEIEWSLGRGIYTTARGHDVTPELVAQTREQIAARVEG